MQRVAGAAGDMGLERLKPQHSAECCGFTCISPVANDTLEDKLNETLRLDNGVRVVNLSGCKFNINQEMTMGKMKVEVTFRTRRIGDQEGKAIVEARTIAKEFEAYSLEDMRMKLFAVTENLQKQVYEEQKKSIAKMILGGH